MKKADYAYHPTLRGEEITSLRNKLGMSIPAMSKFLGVSERMYKYYESGEAPIPKAAGMVIEGMLFGGFKEVKGTLTSFDEERMRVLSDSLYKYAHAVEWDPAMVSKLLRQASDEIDLLLSKFES